MQLIGITFGLNSVKSMSVAAKWAPSCSPGTPRNGNKSRCSSTNIVMKEYLE